MIPEKLQEVASEERDKLTQYDYRLHVCVAAGCHSSGSDQVLEALEDAVEEKGLQESVALKGVGCMGLCVAGPLVAVKPDQILYGNVTPKDADDIIESLGDSPVERILVDEDVPFFTRQERIVLENAGTTEPDSLENYVAAGGYEGLANVVGGMYPEEVVECLSNSGLRGRGGAGFPTGLKWSTVLKAPGDKKYVVCNADEGDPGAFMDRSVLESDPHRVIEGMAIAGYAVGASQGYVYLRAEYPLAIERLKKAIRQAKRNNLLGSGIFDSAFDFNLDIRLGAGAFVCGEETALMHSIEGKRGQPRPRPPYPANYGLWGHPTLINNVETLANVPTILRKGADWFSRIGTSDSKGTKVFALAGRVRNTGLIEVPMGITLREIIYDIGGGIPEGKEFKAVQTGGPSGGCIPKQHLDMPVDYESLREVGSIMGSGGMIVMDSTSCMVDVARYFMDFCRSESCGKCVPCRTGTVQMYDLLDKIATGNATMRDLEMLEDLCEHVEKTSLCGLGQTAPNPVRSTLRYFRDEYIEHIENKCCPAGVCKFKDTAEATV
ncbi:MAG: NADH-quinone oxidoreductase subunit NuoF [Candidatus Brocadiia bacterium]